MRRIATAILLIGAAVLAGPAAAAETAAQDVTVVTGGIGEDEQQSLLAREKEFNLKLVFSLIEGNYLADVDVVVADARGTRLVERQGTGPFLLARLPAGDYRVTANHAGKAVTRKVRVAAGRVKTEYLRWPADPREDLPVSRWLDKE
jgi:hypothetical protein